MKVTISFEIEPKELMECSEIVMNEMQSKMELDKYAGVFKDVLEKIKVPNA